jgi:hypothetical protein
MVRPERRRRSCVESPTRSTIRWSTLPPAWVLCGFPHSLSPRPLHPSSVSPAIHRPPAVHLASLILPHPHLHAHNPCIAYLPFRLSITFIKLILFASEIENGMVKADDPPPEPDVAFQLLRGTHEAGEEFKHYGFTARLPATRHPTTFTLL